MIIAPTVLVPLDGSLHATAALPVARGLAHLERATLAILHVGREARAPHDLIDAVQLSPEDVRGLVVEQRTGPAAPAILQAAAERHSALIVMCSHIQPERAAGTFGSVAEAVLRTAPCPVVLVPPTRGRRPWALHQLLLPHDGTPTSAAAIGPAADLAARAGAELVVLHVATPGAERPTEPGTFVAPRYIDQPQHEWPLWAQEFVARVHGVGRAAGGETTRLAFAEGEAAGAVVDFARRNASDLIALAWRGRLEPERAQTLRRVIRDAGIPVIVFRVEPA